MVMYGRWVLGMVVLLGFVALAEEKTDEQWAKETEEACVATAGEKPTADIIKQKVDAACELLAKEGAAGLVKFKGKGDFVFCGTYIWVHDMAGKMVMHPIKFKLNGKPILGLRDSNGKLFFAEMNKVVEDKGSGWVDYFWPKPGEKEGTQKVSYVKRVKAGDLDLVVGCGVYGLSAEEIAKLTGK